MPAATPRDHRADLRSHRSDGRSQLINLSKSGADTFYKITTGKATSQSIRKVAELGWKPLQLFLIAACIRKNGPRTLVANSRSNSSGDVSRIVPRSVDAPAFTSTLMRPKRRVGFGDHVSGSRPPMRTRRERKGRERPYVAAIRSAAVALLALLVPAGDDYARPRRQPRVAGRPPRRGPARRARDDADLAIHPVHDATS